MILTKKFKEKVNKLEMKELNELHEYILEVWMEKVI